MNIEIKISFTDIAAAAAFLVDAANVNLTAQVLTDEAREKATDVINYVATPAVGNPEAPVGQTPTQQEAAGKPEGKRGPGRPPKAAVKEPESAAAAAAPSAAKPQGSASALIEDPAVVEDAPAPAPAPAKPKTYEETDFAERIMKLVADQKETGNKSKVEALKAALGALGLKSARELKPEQLDGFGEKLAEIERLATTEEALG